MVKTAIVGVLVTGAGVIVKDGVAGETPGSRTGDGPAVVNTGAGGGTGSSGVVKDVQPADKQKQKIIRLAKRHAKPFCDFMFFIIGELCEKGMDENGNPGFR